MQPPNVGIVRRGGQSFPNLPLEQPRILNDCCLFSFAFVMQVSDVEVYGLALALHVSYVLDPHFRTKAAVLIVEIRIFFTLMIEQGPFLALTHVLLQNNRHC
jgi:hypothetical protein